MSADQDLDRNENATPYKLTEARKRGSVSKSRDIVSLGVLSLATIACFSMAGGALRQMAQLMREGLAASHSAPADVIGVSRWVAHLLFAGLSITAPLLVGVALVVIGLTLLNSGVVFSSTPLTPDWTRLNPVTGFKRLFSIKLLYEAVKSTLLLAALVGISFVAMRALAHDVPQLFHLPPRAFLFETVAASGALLAKLAAVIAFFALIDVLFTRWDYLRNLRMSRRQVEDENKHREGDPRIKARLRELRIEYLRRSRSSAKTGEADVLIVNPTHLAIALRYERDKQPAPQVIAKGAGGIAQRMREIAHREGVPVVPHAPLARALFREIETDDYVPERWYPQVARILVWAQSLRNLQRERGLATAREGA